MWSWGDGDYGKLGRGGSDGCKVPRKIDPLLKCQIVKVNISVCYFVGMQESNILSGCQVYIDRLPSCREH